MEIEPIYLVILIVIALVIAALTGYAKESLAAFWQWLGKRTQ